LAAALASAFTTLVSPAHFLPLGLGVLIGLCVGVFPGLGGIAGLSLLMPFLYGMDTVSALAMLVGLVAVIPTSDTFTSVLMGIPGSSASQATVIDGFPLAKQGQAARALAAAFSASLFGGLFGAVVLTALVQVVRPLVLTFGSAELFMLAILGLSMVGVLSGKSLVKGLAACGLGLLVGSIGSAPSTGEFRMTFGLDYLYDGLSLVIVGVGIFAVPEIVELLRRNRPIAGDSALGGNWLGGFKDVVKHWFLCLRCAGIGTLIGIIPGLGGTVVDWIAYGHVLQTSKDKSRFGKGDIRGVIAPESANNAKEGGGLMPTLLFGIPGSGSMAVFLGGMVLLGIEAGPAMVTDQLDLTYTIVWSLALANVLGAGLCIVLAKPIAQLTAVPFNYLAPFMLVVVSFAAFQETRGLADLWALLAVGVLGIQLKRFGWSRPAFLIGFVLAPQAETYLNLAVQFYGWHMLTRPAVIVILLFTVVSVWYGSKGRVDESLSEELASPHPATGSGERVAARWPQIAFAAAVTLFVGYAIVSSLRQSPLGGMFPVGVGIATVLLCAYLLAALRLAPSSNPIVHDAETRVATAGPDRLESTWRNMSWLGGLVVAASLVGFFAATLAFFPAFLRTKAKASWSKSLLLSALAAGILLALGSLLSTDYPGGLLQAYAELPWPFR
jgi:putative tricarboxylic transport membrane protein